MKAIRFPNGDGWTVETAGGRCRFEVHLDGTIYRCAEAADRDIRTHQTQLVNAEVLADATAEDVVGICKALWRPPRDCWEPVGFRRN